MGTPPRFAGDSPARVVGPLLQQPFQEMDVHALHVHVLQPASGVVVVGPRGEGTGVSGRGPAIQEGQPGRAHLRLGRGFLAGDSVVPDRLEPEDRVLARGSVGLWVGDVRLQLIDAGGQLFVRVAQQRADQLGGEGGHEQSAQAWVGVGSADEFAIFGWDDTRNTDVSNVDVVSGFGAGTQDIYYFGEEVDIYEDSEVVSHEGAWRADEPGNHPGIFMPADPKPGMRFAMEGAPGVAEDEGRIVRTDDFGEIVFTLIDAGLVSKNSEDRREDFRGVFDLDEALVQAVNRQPAARVEASGGRLDALYYCPHHPTEGFPPYRRECECRKPKPGMLLAAHVLLQRTRRPSEDQVREALAGNLCRCTGYTKIIEAVLACAT